ncbi:hypothetical protein [Streptomyces sp. NPDC048669]|uniref:hypothetical protein n=1 Tax=Streptomyces sp. NPDC048669 TaxID=3155267 RepID=UPI003420CAC4
MVAERFEGRLLRQRQAGVEFTYEQLWRLENGVRSECAAIAKALGGEVPADAEE